jgi:HAE1 family hydrophobic/amphiphilic exporter-1
MTGEITLRGRILPVGGIKEKAVAALRSGITTVILPKGNFVDIETLPSEVRERVTFRTVERMDEALDLVAILIVHQTLHHMREDLMDPRDAVEEAVRNRVRPIFMSTLTSVFGMLPLVMFPGAGSELYRGLGSVVVGGLALSAVLTLALVPPLLGLFLRVAKPKIQPPGETVAIGSPAGEPAE